MQELGFTMKSSIYLKTKNELYGITYNKKYKAINQLIFIYYFGVYL